MLTPHLGGGVQFYRLNGNSLDVVARLTGYTSHQIGSRNLDMAAAGDFDGDGRLELLLPDNGFLRLEAIQRSAQGAEVVWTVQTGAQMTTNLATTKLVGGGMAVGIGRADGVLRVWVPEK